MKIVYKITCMLLLAILFIAFTGCNDERNFNADIVIPLEHQDGEIVIKEWKFLMGSGVEVYFKQDEELTELGRFVPGDDAWCPFEKGLYDFIEEEGEITIKWCRRIDGPQEKWKPKETWETVSYILP